MTERTYLFIVWEGGGNLPPMLALAGQMAREEDTAVSVLGPPSVRDRVEGLGATYIEAAGAHPRLALLDMSEDFAGITQYIAGTESARAALDVIEGVAPSAAIVDCMQFAALTAAEKAGVPTASFLHMRYGFFTEDARDDIDNWLREPLGAARVELGLAPLDDGDSIARQVWDRCATSVSMLIPDLESPLDVHPRQLVHVGPIFDVPAPPPPPTHESESPLILVSFSTTQMHQGPALQNVLDAVATVEARAICTTGDVDVGDLRPPANAEVVPWIAHADVLPRASAVVTHAGMGTTLAALAHGVPLVVMPMGRDQDGNAQRVEEVGAGVRLEPTARAEEIAEALERVLHEETFAKAGRRLARAIGQFDNGALAVSTLGWM